MKKNILVTGGLGFIGSHVVVELAEAGYDVLIVDDLSNSQISVLDGLESITGKRLPFIKGDLSDPLVTQSLFDSHAIDAIIHFAAKKAVGESVQNPLLYYKVNIGSMINLLEGMKKQNVKHIVFSSSCTVYGQPNVLPVTESTPWQPANSPYGYTKQVCESLLKDLTTVEENISGTSLRYFNPVGAHSSSKIGELPLGVPNNLVPFITQTAAGLRDHLSVFGGDYSTKDGTAIRDYIHVVDLAKAHITALERQLGGAPNYEVFNIGAGGGHSVLEVIHAFEKVSNQKLPYKIVERRPGDVEQIWADTQLANSVLNWQASLSLEDMMKDAWKWQLELMKNT
jgi:UDP-glucose 4-epimerase